MAPLKSIHLFFVVLFIMLPTQYVFANNWLLSFGYNQGGERLFTIYGIRPDDTVYEQKLHAGDSYSLNAGYLFNINNSNLDVQLSFGYQADGITLVGFEADFHNYPLEIIPFYHQGAHRLGAGLSYHVSPKFSVEGASNDADFDDAPGLLVEYDYHFSGWGSKGLSVGARYEWVQYEIDDLDFDGDHWGVQLSWLF